MSLSADRRSHMSQLCKGSPYWQDLEQFCVAGSIEPWWLAGLWPMPWMDLGVTFSFRPKPYLQFFNKPSVDGAIRQTGVLLIGQVIILVKNLWNATMPTLSNILRCYFYIMFSPMRKLSFLLVKDRLLLNMKKFCCCCCCNGNKKRYLKVQVLLRS